MMISERLRGEVRKRRRRWIRSRSIAFIPLPTRKNEIEKELQSLLTVSKNRQNESNQYPDSNNSLTGFESDLSLTQQIHSLHESTSFVSNDLPLPSTSDKPAPMKCLSFTETEEKEECGFDSILDSSILEEADRIEAETQTSILNDTELLTLAESMT